MSSLEERFWKKVSVSNEDECWTWNASKDQCGYGMIGSRGKVMRAHRVSWEIFNTKKIPAGMVIMHSCDNPSCVNPRHLALGTQQENIDDRTRKGRGADVSGKKNSFWNKKHSDGAKRKISKSLSGENSSSSKLSEKDVLEIRRLYSTGDYTARILGEMFRVGKTTILNIINRKTWRNI